MLTKFLNGRVLTKVPKSSEQRLSALNLPGEIGKNSNDFLVHHRRKFFNRAV